MKRFLLSLVVSLAFASMAFAIPGEGDDPRRPPPPLPEITVEVDSPEITVGLVDNSVTVGVDIAEQYVRNVVTPIVLEVGPEADMVMYNFREMTAFLNEQGIDVTELALLGNKAAKNYTVGRTLFAQGMVYAQLGSILAKEANTAEGTEALILRTRAASAYYTAAIYAERSRGPCYYADGIGL